MNTELMVFSVQELAASQAAIKIDLTKELQRITDEWVCAKFLLMKKGLYHEFKQVQNEMEDLVRVSERVQKRA